MNRIEIFHRNPETRCSLLDLAAEIIAKHRAKKAAASERATEPSEYVTAPLALPEPVAEFAARELTGQFDDYQNLKVALTTGESTAIYPVTASRLSIEDGITWQNGKKVLSARAKMARILEKQS